ncbi:endolytic transglycosylase MltG [Falseniella ignava]
MSEKSREEALSFKEQILRDLERVKGNDEKKKEVEIPTLTIPSSQPTPPAPSSPELEPSTEDLMVDSLSAVDEIFKNALNMPSHSSFEPEEPVAAKQEESVVQKQEESMQPEFVQPEVKPVALEPVEPKIEEKEFNETPLKVAVSYKTEEREPEPVLPMGKEVAPAPVEEVDILAEAPCRSRRGGTKLAKKKKKSHAKALLAFVVILILLLSSGGFFGYRYVQSALEPVDANSKKYVTVQIPEGANIQEIGSTLEKSGLVKHGIIFSLYAKYNNYSDLKSGYYNLKKSMSTDDLIKELQKGGTPEPQEPTLASLTIPEGYTLEQIAQTVGQLQGDFKEALTSEAFLAKAQDETFIAQEVAKYPNLLGSLPTKDSGVRYRLEGYLFPATYTIKESTTVESLIDEMLAAMDKALSPHYNTIKEKNLTVNELLSIASLVEKEGAKTEDRKMIAGVFYNRLNLGMPLQSNIAILYAEGKLGQKISLAEDAAIDTTIDSPYNVYTNLGLMPGPVDSPSLDAIESSINQTKSENLYFVANVEDGKVYFAKTKEEHDQNVAEHINSKLPQSSSSN